MTALDRFASYERFTKIWECWQTDNFIVVTKLYQIVIVICLFCAERVHSVEYLFAFTVPADVLCWMVSVREMHICIVKYVTITSCFNCLDALESTSLVFSAPHATTRWWWHWHCCWLWWLCNSPVYTFDIHVIKLDHSRSTDCSQIEMAFLTTHLSELRSDLP